MAGMQAPGTPWADPPGRLSLGCGEVHLWLVPTAPPDSAQEELEWLVSAAEMDRCRKMARLMDRRRFLSVRGALRKILSGYLQIPAPSIAISYSSSGKPFLEPVSRRPERLHFSVSHAADIALIAVGRDSVVGVDIERVRRLQARDDVLADFFSSQERDWVHAHADEGKDDAFFRVWTRREATSKVFGMGLVESFLRLRVPAAEYSPGGFRLVLPDSEYCEKEGRQEWWIRDLIPAAGHAGALCLENENREPVFCRFSW
jgi:4'-phosphopantetheinyl transferase